MKVLYAIQATGNGHVSRATEIIPILKTKCELDILISGTEADINLNHEIKYRRKGLCYVFGKKGGVDIWETLKKMNIRRFLNEINNFPVEQYDLVINDFEPITSWASKKKHIPCIAMSHQFAVINKKAPKPVFSDPIAWLILHHYIPCKTGIGFHFKSYAENIHTPVIRSEIRHANITNAGHYTVYLPAYDEKKLIRVFSAFKNTRFEIFSKHTNDSFVINNCWVRPVDSKNFRDSFISCEGIITGGGFETPAEAIYMGKKLLAIPMSNQYEQHCNAAAMKELGVTVIKNLGSRYMGTIKKWLDSDERIQINYEDETEKIIDAILAQHRCVEMKHYNPSFTTVAQTS
jgi:uncharacterized protein (TIGR00661 family)